MVGLEKRRKYVRMLKLKFPDVEGQPDSSIVRHLDSQRMYMALDWADSGRGLAPSSYARAEHFDIWLAGSRTMAAFLVRRSIDLSRRPHALLRARIYIGQLGSSLFLSPLGIRSSKPRSPTRKKEKMASRAECVKNRLHRCVGFTRISFQDGKGSKLSLLIASKDLVDCTVIGYM